MDSLHLMQNPVDTFQSQDARARAISIILTNMTSIAQDKSIKPDYWIYIISILIISGIRLYLPWYRQHDSIWQDEAWSIMISEMSFRDLLHLNIHSDTVPPLYYLILHSWRMVFGSLEVPMRLLSVFFGFTSVTLTFLVVRQRFSLETTLFATLLVGLSPQLMFNATEIRYYSLLLTMSLLLIYISNIIIDISWKTLPISDYRRYLWLWGICAFLLLMTHHFGGWVILGCVVYILNSVNSKKLPPINYWYYPSALGVIFGFVWVIVLGKQLAFLHMNKSSLSAVTPIDLISFWSDTLFLRFLDTAHIQRADASFLAEIMGYKWLLLGLLLFVIVIYLGVMELKKTTEKVRRNFIILMISCAVFIPTVTYFVAVILNSPQLLSRRYVPIVAWAVLIIAAIVLDKPVAQRPDWINRVLSITIMILMTFSILNIINPSGQFMNHDWRRAARILHSRVRPIDLIVVCEPENDLAIRYSPCLNYYWPWHYQSWRTGPGGIVPKRPEQLLRGVNETGQGKVIQHMFKTMLNRPGLRTMDNYYQRFVNIEGLAKDLDRMKGDTIVWLVIPVGEESTALKIAERLKDKFTLFDTKTDFTLRHLRIVRLQRIG